MEHRAWGTEHRAQSTEHRAWGMAGTGKPEHGNRRPQTGKGISHKDQSQGSVAVISKELATETVN